MIRFLCRITIRHVFPTCFTMSRFVFLGNGFCFAMCAASRDQPNRQGQTPSIGHGTPTELTPPSLFFLMGTKHPQNYFTDTRTWGSPKDVCETSHKKVVYGKEHQNYFSRVTQIQPIPQKFLWRWLDMCWTSGHTRLLDVCVFRDTKCRHTFNNKPFGEFLVLTRKKFPTEHPHFFLCLFAFSLCWFLCVVLFFVVLFFVMFCLSLLCFVFVFFLFGCFLSCCFVLCCGVSRCVGSDWVGLFGFGFPCLKCEKEEVKMCNLPWCGQDTFETQFWWCLFF